MKRHVVCCAHHIRQQLSSARRAACEDHSSPCQHLPNWTQHRYTTVAPLREPPKASNQVVGGAAVSSKWAWPKTTPPMMQGV